MSEWAASERASTRGEPPDLSELPPAVGYRYALPTGWIHIDLDPRRRHASVRRAVGARIRAMPHLRPHRASIEGLLQQECAVALGSGADRLSVLAEPGDRTGPAGPAFLTAAVTFALASDTSPESPPRASRAWGLRAALVEAHRAEQVHDPAARLDLVALAQSDAVLRCWTDALVLPSGARIRHRIWQLIVPWPGRAALGLLTLSSPTVPAWPLLGSMFDACIKTFHWTWAGSADHESEGPERPDRSISTSVGDHRPRGPCRP